MPKDCPHISVCICTYKRPQLLKRALDGLCNQDTAGLFTYSAVVSDNDHLQSARPVVLEFGATSSLRIEYCVEPRQNISLTRNAALNQATGEFVAFLDDDEFPTKKWLLTLFAAYRQHGVDGVLGPVKPHFDQKPPAWIVKGGFYDRACYPTGMVINWRQGRTGNVLLRRSIFKDLEQPFDPAFTTGEDQDFFRRMIAKGHVFIWCNEAVAYEVVPSVRWKRTFMLRRAFLRGRVRLKGPNVGFLDTGKSLIAITAYGLALPVFLLFGHHVFMNYLIKACDHAGKLLALVGLNPVEDKYVTE